MSQVDTSGYNFVYRVVFLVGLVTLAVASGWVVARFHRPFQRSLLVAYGASFSVHAGLTGCYFVYLSLPVLFFEPTAFTAPQLELITTAERFALVGWVADATLYFSTFAVGIFVGGLLSELSYKSPPDRTVQALR